MHDIADIRKCVALIVGISDYDHNMKLRNAVNDAYAIHQVLTSMNYDARLYKNATYDEFSDAFYAMLGENQFDVVIIYFAGHGMYCNMSDCIVFKDAPQMDRLDGMPARKKSYKVEELIQEIRSQQDSAMIITIIDACRTDFILSFPLKST